MTDQIIGYGGGRSSGGGGKGSTGQSKAPVEAANTLTSKSVLSALFLLGEGELGGFYNDDLAQSVYFDDVPLKNADGTYNFQGVTLDYRPGTLSQSYIPSEAASKAEFAVSQQVKKTVGPVTRTITNSDIDAITLRFTFPALQLVNSSNNSIEPTSIWYKVEIQANGGSWVERVKDVISGKCTSPVERFYKLALPKASSWNVRVTRLTDDSTSSTLSNDMYWTSYTTIVESKFRYPNSALLYIRIPGEYFRSLPRVSYRGKFKKILVPSNYDPVARTYSGMWNGNFIYRYSNNPAWVAYDMLINGRYGAGQRLSADSVDKWGFYAVAQYCDQMIPSSVPGGGMVPRFTCNAYIRDAQEAYELLNQIGSCFRGALYWGSSKVFPTQDKPSLPVKIFTKANVLETVDENGQLTEPGFKYAYSSKTARHTVAIVQYQNPDLNFKTDFEYVEHPDGLARYGYNLVELKAFGCTSRDQARRYGLWVLQTEQNLTKTVTFKVGAEGAFLSPGEVIQISDPLRSVNRYGGRLKKTYVAENVFILDAAIADIAVGDTLKVTYPTTGYRNFTVNSYDASHPDGFAVGVSPGIGSSPIENAVWVLEKPTLKPEQYRVFSIVDRLGDSASCYEVSATQYNDSLYDAVDFGEPIENLPTVLLPPPVPNKPFNIRAALNPTFRDGRWYFDIKADWDEPLYNGGVDPYTSRYEVELRPGVAGAWGSPKTTSDPSCEYTNLVEDTYYLRVKAIDVLTRSSAWAESVAYILTRPAPADPIGNIVKNTTLTSGIILTWSDTQTYPYGIVGYNIYIDNVLFQTVPFGIYYTAEIIKPPGVYNVVIKPVDRAGTVSANGLTTVLGSEFAPKNPSGEITMAILDSGQIQLFWTDAQTYEKGFAGYRVIMDGQQLEDTTNKFTTPFSVTAGVAHNFKVYSRNSQGYLSLGYIEFALSADNSSFTVPNPSGIITKRLAPDGGVILDWTDTQIYTSFSGYRVFLNGVLQGETPVKGFPSLKVAPGTYTVTVKSKSRSGLQSVGGIATQIVPEDIIPPAPSYLLVQQALNGSKQFYWDIPADYPRDVTTYRLRYNVGASQNWENSHFLKDLPIDTDTYESTLFRQGIYTILLKTVDITGYESDDLVFTQVNLGDPVPDNVVELYDYRTPSASDTPSDFPLRSTWQGTSYNLQHDSNGDLITIDSNDIAIFDSTFEVTTSGHLKVAEEIDGNYALYYERVTQGIIWLAGNDTTVFWSSANDSEVLWKQFDKFIPFPVAVAVDQEEYKVRIFLQPGGGRIKQLKVMVDAPDIVESFNDIAISSLGTRIAPSKPMTFLKSVNLTLQDPVGNTATRVLIKDKDPVNGALVEAYNSSGTRVPALLDAIIVGY